MPEIPKTYEPQKYEDEIYKLWEKSGFFNPDNLKNTKDKYSNILPPPNANGELHLGHAAGYAVMDIFGRWQRMKNKKVLLLPGKDHAGILTQVVYERKLKEERKITRQDLGRGKFYQECYDFCLDKANYMRSQEKKIGISADWSREKFTLDPEVSKITLETFVKMYNDGLIYRGERIINWCPRCQTALSDLEVEHKVIEGKIYHIKYPIKDSSESITVATTRPETMLGDTAVAINPKDKKYLSLVGKIAILPLMNREIPIIADKRVEIGFETGAVKITPAHDALDWEIGKDNKLKVIQVINEKAEITDEGEKYAGQDVLEARENIVEDLKKLKLLGKIEETEIPILACERCKDIIQPLISKQWFIDVDAKKYSLKKESLKAIESGEIRVYPESFKKILTQWFENLRDWCISRQIWWGHQMPVWYKNEEIYVGLNPPKGDNWKQEEDTFDTWFSSGQWAYSTLEYPNGKDYKEFYPTEMMVMGRDILFFWSARMTMLSLYRTGKIPFKELYFTGLIRDKAGQKMSKSKGNGIDPLEMIKKYGADALRLSLVMGTSPGQDIKLYEKKIEGYRNFVTKLWNIYRYSASSRDFKLIDKIDKKDIETLADKWIVSQINETMLTITSFMEYKEISLAQDTLRRFTWDQLADWYLEIHKMEKNDRVLGYVLDKILKLWHPFTPFVTEKIWQDLYKGEKILMVEKWPVGDKKLIDKKAEAEFEGLKEIITKIRNLRSSYHINPSEVIKASAKNLSNQEIIEKLARIKFEEREIKGITVASQNTKVILDIADIIDVKKEAERLAKEIKNLESLISKTEALLGNKKFTSSAPADIINANSAKINEYRERLQSQHGLLEDLKQLNK